MVRYRFWWRLRLFIWNRFLFLKIGWELSLRKVNWCLIGVRRKVFSINLSLRRFFLSAFEATSTGRVWSTLNSFIGSINWTVYSVYSTRWVANKLRILLYGISISVLWYVADARVWIVLLRCSLLDWALRDQHALHVLGATVPFKCIFVLIDCRTHLSVLGGLEVAQRSCAIGYIWDRCVLIFDELVVEGKDSLLVSCWGLVLARFWGNFPKKCIVFFYRAFKRTMRRLQSVDA